MSDRIPLSTPHMSEEKYELEYIQDAFRKNWIAPLGENVNELESAMGGYLGGHWPVALSSGTAALHLALVLAGVGPGDQVFCQSLTFAASANPIVYQGARPVFVDSEPVTWNMDPAALERAIAVHGVPKAVIAVHLYGVPARMGEICEICRRHGIVLIEDAAEALGSTYKGTRCGILGDYGVLSFNGNKIITTSGGGMLLCREKNQAELALKLATQAREPVPWYEHEMIGYNYRLSNISAGIGRGQMKVLPLRVEQKREIFRRYREMLSGLPLTFQQELPGCVSNRWLTAVLPEKGCGVSPADLIEGMNRVNAESRHLWKPLHRQPVFAQVPYVTAGADSVSDDLFSRGVCLPSDTKMTEADLERVCDGIRKVFA